MIQAQWQTWIVTSLIMSIVVFGISFGLSMVVAAMQAGATIGTGPNETPNLALLVPALIVRFLTTIVQTTIQMCFTVGIAYMGIRQSKGESIAVDDLFKGFKNFGSVLVVAMLVSFINLLGFCCCIIPGVYLTGLTALAAVIAGFQGIGPIDAIQESMAALKPHAWAMFGLVLVAGLVSGLGVLACCVGILFTLPISGIVLGLTYDTFYPSTGGNYQPTPGYPPVQGA